MCIPLRRMKNEEYDAMTMRRKKKRAVVVAMMMVTMPAEHSSRPILSRRVELSSQSNPQSSHSSPPPSSFAAIDARHPVERPRPRVERRRWHSARCERRGLWRMRPVDLFGGGGRQCRSPSNVSVCLWVVAGWMTK